VGQEQEYYNRKQTEGKHACNYIRNLTTIIPFKYKKKWRETTILIY
jgi:hypothetical protein